MTGQKAILSVSGFLLAMLLVSLSSAQEKTDNETRIPPGYVSIRVFDNQSRFVGRILPQKRYWAPIDRIPVFLQNALVAVEDARFYEHKGIDIRGITRALVKDVAKGKMVEGGSTITQQLIKNKYLSSSSGSRRRRSSRCT